MILYTPISQRNRSERNRITDHGVIALSLSLSLCLSVCLQVSDQESLGGGSLWSQITKSVSDYQLNSVQAQVGVVCQ